MSCRIKGITVKLHLQKKVGEDALGVPIYEEQLIDVDNVLVAPASSTDLPEANNLDGKKAVYTLAIPKGDNNDWEDTIVEFFGRAWKTFGFGQIGIEEMIPLDWNKKVQVEAYE